MASGVHEAFPNDAQSAVNSSLAVSALLEGDPVYNPDQQLKSCTVQGAKSKRPVVLEPGTYATGSAAVPS